VNLHEIVPLEHRHRDMFFFRVFEWAGNCAERNVCYDDPMLASTINKSQLRFLSNRLLRLPLLYVEAIAANDTPFRVALGSIRRGTLSNGMRHLE
jgi:hypothetical protein